MGARQGVKCKLLCNRISRFAGEKILCPDSLPSGVIA